MTFSCIYMRIFMHDMSVHADLLGAIERSGLTQQAIGKRLKISQSQISRITSGQATTRSKAYRRLCALMRVEWHVADIQRGRKGRSNAQIQAAVNHVWDGTPEHAEAIANVIRSLGVFELNVKR